MMAKRLAILVLFILAGAGTALASSTPVDPSIILRDATCGTGCQIITTSNFTFDVGSTGGGLFTFQDNVSDITSLTFIFKNPGGIDNTNIGSLVSCQVLSFFDNCSKSLLGNGSIEIVFSGVGGEDCSGDSDDDNEISDPDEGNNGHSECNGIPKGTIFTLDLFNQTNGQDDTSGGWVMNSAVSGSVNTPEPGTFLLLLTGLPLIGLRKRQ